MKLYQNTFHANPLALSRLNATVGDLLVWKQFIKL